MNKANIEKFIESCIEKENVEPFLLWALGSGFETILFCDWPEAWNKLHGDELTLTKRGKWTRDLLDMIDIWRKDD
jgi:hypothetical protein